MLEPGKPCPLCEMPLILRRLTPFSGDEKPLRITLAGMPALACTAPHTYFVEPAFPMWLMNHLVEEDEAKLPAGEGKGLIVKHYLCADCGKPLEAKQDHRHSFRVPMSYKDYAGFEVEISMPVYKCGGCGKEQLHSLRELRKLTPAALVHAFKAAGIKPPG